MHWLFIILILIIQMIGAVAAVHYYLRMRKSKGGQRHVWLVLMSLISGGTGFTAHFMTIAAVPPGPLLIIDIRFALLSFVIALACVGLPVYIADKLPRPYSTIVFGLVFHLMVSVGNLGVLMSAETPGTITFDNRLIAMALVVTFCMAVLGGYYANRAQTLRQGLAGGAALGFLTPVQDLIILSGMVVEIDPSLPVPKGLSTDTTLIAVLICATFVILLVGGSGVLLERSLDRQVRQRYRELAYSDALTGLHNRIGFSDALKSVFARSGSGDAMLMIDLDKFKSINDVYGHAAGDEVLKAVADRMREGLPKTAIAGRMGGDEFVAYLPLGDADASAPARAATLLAALNEPVLFDEKTIAVGASIGLALRGRDGDTPDALLAAADIALYRAKDMRGQVIEYAPEMGAEARKRTQIEVEIRRALQEQEFVLFFQPQVDLVSQRIIGFEALLRWQHPERGLVPPGAFLPIAEESTLITDIGAWVLGEACRIAADWPTRYSVAVNVAARQLGLPDFVEQVHDALWSSGLSAHRLEIELTEASVIEDEAQALSVMQELRRCGVRLAMDDYGTGYASLAALRKFPFDKLKIDRSFVDGLSRDPQAEAIIRSTLVLTNALSLPVIAEGVETQAHVDFLVSEGCHNVQGYFFGKPMSQQDVVLAIQKDQEESRRA